MPKSVKAVAIPLTPKAIVPLPTQQQMLKTASTKPVVKPPSVAKINKMTKPLKSYLPPGL